MNTYLFFSPTNEQVIAICALNVSSAIRMLDAFNINQNKDIMKDDYIYVNNMPCKIGAITSISTNK
jgi:hypothetical protein